jgi:hypothetical protein
MGARESVLIHCSGENGRRALGDRSPKASPNILSELGAYTFTRLFAIQRKHGLILALVVVESRQAAELIEAVLKFLPTVCGLGRDAQEVRPTRSGCEAADQ